MAVLDPTRFVGRAPEQVDAFLAREVEPIRKRYPDRLGQRRDVHDDVFRPRMNQRGH